MYNYYRVAETTVGTLETAKYYAEVSGGNIVEVIVIWSEETGENIVIEHEVKK